MMKRVGNIFQEVYSWNNLLEACRRAKKGASHSRDAVIFFLNLDRNLKRLQESIASGNSPVGNYHYFTIHDPKERMICAASFEERVLYHAVIRILEPRFEQHFIHDTYACRKGKGTEKAIEKAFLNTRSSRWFLKLDMRKYFDSIDHKILQKKLCKIIKDHNILKLLGQIIASYSVNPGKGIPIGNLTSQYFANFYLSFFDHFVKEQLKVKRYVRYMDDCILWCNNKYEAATWKEQTERYLYEELQLSLKYSVLNRTAKGVPFLGFLIKSDRILLVRAKKSRSKAKLKQLYRELVGGRISQQEFSDKITASLAHLKLARSRKVVYDFLQRYDHRLEPGSPGRQLEQ
jgi:RNA-directed DNA polymerase